MDGLALLEFNEPINWFNKSEVAEDMLRLELRLREEDTSEKITAW